MTFDDSAVHKTVIISGSVTPGGILVDTNVGYTFSGSGNIQGSGALIKRGTGLLTIGNSNDSYTGNTVIEQGGISISNVNSLGGASSVITMWDGTSLSVPNNFDRKIVLDDGASITLTLPSGDATLKSLIEGTGNVTIAGTGRRIFEGTTGFTGTLTVNDYFRFTASSVNWENTHVVMANTSPTANSEINGAGTKKFASLSLAGGTTTLEAANVIVDIPLLKGINASGTTYFQKGNDNNRQTSSTGKITIDVVAGGTLQHEVPIELTGLSTLEKTGPGTLNLGSSNWDSTGAYKFNHIVVEEGVLLLQGKNNLKDAWRNVANGATLTVKNGGTFQFGGPGDTFGSWGADSGEIPFKTYIQKGGKVIVALQGTNAHALGDIYFSGGSLAQNNSTTDNFALVGTVYVSPNTDPSAGALGTEENPTVSTISGPRKVSLAQQEKSTLRNIDFVVDAAAELLVTAQFAKRLGDSQSSGFTKKGLGTMELQAANEYFGATIVDAGRLKISDGASFSTDAAATFVVNAGATLEFNRTDTALNMPNAFSGAGEIAKVNTGTVSLANLTNFTGRATVKGGTLDVSGGPSLGIRSINVNGGTLNIGSAKTLVLSTSQSSIAGHAAAGPFSGDDVTGSLSLSGGHTLTVGAMGSVDVLNITGGLALNNATLCLELLGNSSGGDYDKIILGDALTLGGTSTLSFAHSGLTQSSVFDLITSNVAIGSNVLTGLSIAWQTSAPDFATALKLSDDGKTLQLALTPYEYYWRASSSAAWGDAIWVNEAKKDAWMPGDLMNIPAGLNAVFDDEAGIDPNVAITAATEISRVRVVGGQYVFTNDGGKLANLSAGTGSLEVNGSSTKLTLTSTLGSGGNEFTGAVTISNQGEIELSDTGGGAVAYIGNDGQASLLGAGSGAAGLVLDGGKLTFAGTKATTTDRLFTLGASGGTLQADAKITFSGTGAIAFGGAGTRTLTLAGSNTASSLAAVLGNAGTDAVSVVKRDAGTWYLNGANTFTGGVSLQGGTLGVGHATALGTGTLTFGGTGTLTNATEGGLGQTLSLANAVALNAAATISVAASTTLTFTGNITGSNGFTKIGTGILELQGSNTYGGATAVDVGTLKLVASGNLPAATTLTLFANTVFDISAASGGRAISGLSSTASNANVTLGANSLTLGGNSSSFVGVISGTGGLTLTGSSFVVSLSGANTYSGVTKLGEGSLGQGRLKITGSGSLENSVVAGRNVGGIHFDISESTNSTVIIGGLIGSGDMVNAVKLGSNTLQIGKHGVPGADGQFTASIGNGGDTGGFTKEGTFTFTYAPNQAERHVRYTGETAILQGTYRLAPTVGSGEYALMASSGVRLADEATAIFDISANYADSTRIRALTGGGTAGGTVTLGDKTLIVGGSTTVGSGSSTMGEITGTGTGTFGGVIVGTGGKITKDGTGVFVLTGTNTYTGGTKVSGGELSIASLANIGSGGVTFDGGKLAVTGVSAFDVSNRTNAITASSQISTQAAIRFGNVTGSGSLQNLGTANLLSIGSFSGTINSEKLSVEVGKTLATATNVKALSAHGTTLGVATIGSLNGGAQLGNFTLNIRNEADAAGALDRYDSFAVTGAVDFSGSATYIINLTDWIGGTYNLLTAGTLDITGFDTTSAGLLSDHIRINGSSAASDVRHGASLAKVSDTLQLKFFDQSFALTWNGDSTNSWDGAQANTVWQKTVAGDSYFLRGDAVSFTNTGNFTDDVVVDGSRVVASMDVTGGSYTFVGAGTSALIQGSTAASSPAFTVTSTLTISGSGTTTFDVAVDFEQIAVTAGTAVFKKAVSASQDAASQIAISGSGTTVTFASTVGASDGVTIATGSKVVFQPDTATTSNAVDVSLSNGTVEFDIDPGAVPTTPFSYEHSGEISGTGTLTKKNGGTLVLSGVNTLAGIVAVEAGILEAENTACLGTADITLGNTATTAGTLKLTALVPDTLGARTLTVAAGGGTLNNAGRLTFGSGATLTGSGALTFAGIGGAVINAATTSGHTGAVTLSAGSLELQTVDALAASSALNLTGGDATAGKSQQFKGLNIASGHSFTFTGGTASERNLTLIGGVNFHSDIAGDLTGVNDLVLGNGAALTLAPLATLSIGGDFTLGDSSKLTVNAGNASAPGIIEVAGALNFTGGTGVESIINIGGYTNQQTYVVATANSITGIYKAYVGNSEYTWNTSGTSLPQTANEARYLDLTLAKTTSGGLEHLGVKTSLVWDNTGDASAHGTFFVDGTSSKFTIGVYPDIVATLNDNATSTAWYTTADGLWDGKTLTKTGSGELVLATDNNYTGKTIVKDGWLTLKTGKATGQGKSAPDAVVNLGTDATLAFDFANNDTFAEVITGAGSVVKNNSVGTVTLTGVSTYTGATTVKGGTLALSGAGSIADSSGLTLDDASAKLDITWVTAGATLKGLASTFATSEVDAAGKTLQVGTNGQADGAGSFAGKITGTNGQLVKEGSGTLTLSGANTYTGATTVKAGPLALTGAGSIASSSGLTLGGASAKFDIAAATSGAIVRGLASTFATSEVIIGNKIFQVGTAGEADGAGSFAGKIIGTNGQLVKEGGGTLTLSGANTYTGATTVNTGILALGGAGSIASSTGLTLAANTGFDISGITSSATIKAFTGDNGSTLVLGSKALTIGSAGQANGNGTFAGSITGSGALAKTGTGTLVLSAASLGFSGTTNVAQGCMDLHNAAALGSGQVTIAAGATLLAGASGTYVNKLAGAGMFLVNSPVVATLAGGSTSFTGTVSVSGTGAVQISSAANLGTARLNLGDAASVGSLVTTGTAAIDLGSRSVTLGTAGGSFDVADVAQKVSITPSFSGGPLTKTGAGTLTLKAYPNLSYSGNVSVNQGTLVLNSDNVIGTGGITIDSPATLSIEATGSYSNVLTGTGTVVVASSNAVLLASNLGFSGTFSVKSLGILGISAVGNVGNNATILIGDATTRGTLRMLGTGDTFIDLGTRSVVLGAVSGTIDVLGGDRKMSLQGELSGSGRLQKTGPGTLILSGSNTYTGGTDLTVGSLVAGSDQALGTGTFLHSSLGTLGFADGVSIPNTIVLNTAAVRSFDVGGADTATITSDLLSNSLGATATLKKVGTGKLILASNTALDGIKTVVDISEGTLEITKASFDKKLTGAGTLQATLNDASTEFSFGSAVGTDFTGTFELARGVIVLNATNGVPLARTTLKLGADSTAKVTENRTLGTLALGGGTLDFAVTNLAPDGLLRVTSLDIGGGGTIRADLGKPVDTSLPGPGTNIYDLWVGGANYQQQIVAADTVVTGGVLLWEDYSGANIASGEQIRLIETAADGRVGFLKFDYLASVKTDSLVAGGNGLYLGFGLAEISADANKVVVLDATGAAQPKLHAHLTGEGGFTFTGTVGTTVEIGGVANDYTGPTEINRIRAVMASNNAFGDRTDIVLTGNARLDMAGHSQVANSLSSQDATSQVKLGDLTVGAGNFAGELTGPGTFTKAGGGEFTLAGRATHTGDTTVTGGTLKVAGTLGTMLPPTSGSNLISMSHVGSFHVQGDGLLLLSQAGDIAQEISGNFDGNGKIVKAGGGTLILSGANTAYTGTLAVTGGEVRISANEHLGLGVNTLDGGKLTLGGPSGYDHARNWTMGPNGGIISNRDDYVFSGVLTGEGSMAKEGSGKLTLIAPALHAGVTEFREGYVVLGVEDAVARSAAVVLMGSSVESLHSQTFNTLEIFQGRSLTMAGADGLERNLSVTGGQIAGSIIGLHDLVKRGAGALALTETLSVPLSLDGKLIVESGTLAIALVEGREPVIRATSVKFAPQAVLDISGYNATSFDSGTTSFTLIETSDLIRDEDFPALYTVGGTVSPKFVTAQILPGANGRSIVVDLGLAWYDKHVDAVGQHDRAHGVFELDAGGSFTLSSPLNDREFPFVSLLGWDGRTLRKTGAGALTLAAANTYSGPTYVDGGSLIVTGSLGVSVNAASSYDGSVVVNGGTLVFDQLTAQILHGDIRGSGAIVKRGSGLLSLTGDVDLGSLTVDLYSRVAFEGNAVALGSLTVNGEAALDSGVEVATSDITLGARSRVTLNTGATLRLSGNGELGADLYGTGLLVNERGSSLVTKGIAGAFTNKGEAQVGGSIGGRLYNEGLTVVDGGVVGGVENATGGRLQVNGSVRGGLNNNGMAIVKGVVYGGLHNKAGAEDQPGASYILSPDFKRYEIAGTLYNSGRVRFENLGQTLAVENLANDSDAPGYYDIEVDIGSPVNSDHIELGVGGSVIGRHIFNIYNVFNPEKATPGTRIDLITGGKINKEAVIEITRPLNVGLFQYDIIDGATIGMTAYSSSAQVATNMAGAMSLGWFSQLDNLTKRIGELHLSGATVAPGNGTAAAPGKRHSGSEMEEYFWVRGYGQQIDADLKLDAVRGFRENQYGGDVGADLAFTLSADSLLYVGAFVGYQGASRNFKDGVSSKSDTQSVSVGAYLAWQHSTGWFADALLKGQHFDTDYRIEGVKGGFKNQGIGFTLRAGRRWENATRWFLEPSFQLDYTHIFTEDYSMDSGIKVKTTDMDLLRYSGSLRAGKTFELAAGRAIQPYAKVGAEYQDSSGNTVRAATAEYSGSWRPSTDGTRVVLGVGVAWQWSPSQQVHFDGETAFGSKYDTPWSLNLGYRARF
ncbi:MAG: autotransporter-associated beta strand repeat-containing protein [Puniceicoccales bacterium]|nr:autotransporter-associated beta strand repeat-containing protein [Puniceicoccales bacterium]